MLCRSRFFLVVYLSVSMLWMVVSRADAQPGRKGTGRTPTPSIIRPAVTGAANTVRSVATVPTPQPSYNYHIYPSSSPAIAPVPLGWASAPAINYAYHYYYAPTYPATGARGASYPSPFWYFETSGPLLPSMFPRTNAEPPSKEAKIEILMPRSDAVLLVDGSKTSTGGLRRLFTSPTLEPGTYAYQLTAHWTSQGQEVRLERTVEVSPGGTYFVDFNKIDLTVSKATK